MKSSKAKRSPAGGRTAAAVAPAPKTAKFPHFWTVAASCAIAAVVVFMVYGRVLNGPFLLDDDYLPYRLPGMMAAPLRAWIDGNRPLLMLSFWLNFHAAGSSTYGYHLVNVLLHCLNGAWIYLAVRKLLAMAQTAAVGSNAGAPSRIQPRMQWTREVAAIFAAGLFLLHPLQTESVSYIASRSELLSVCFFLAAFDVFLYAREAPSVGRIAAILALFIAACLSKEHTVILPALLLLTDYYWNPGFSLEGIRRHWRLYTGVLVIAAAGGAFVWFAVLSKAATAGFHVAGVTWYAYFFTECRVIWKYLLLFAFPFGLNVDADVPLSHNLIDHGAIVGLIALAAVSVAAWMYRRRYPIASYGWFVFLLLIAPTSSFVPIADPYAERRLYLPFIGLTLIAVEFVRRWKAGQGTIVAALAGVLLVEGALTYQRNGLWTDAVAIWGDAARKSPHKVRPAWQHALALYDAGQCADAVKEYSRAATLATPEYGLLVDWGLAYDCVGDSDNALARLQQAAQLKPSAHAYSQIGMEYAKRRDWTHAMAALNESLRLDGSYVKSYIYRGGVYESQGQFADAANDYRRALAIDPGNAEAQQALARVVR